MDYQDNETLPSSTFHFSKSQLDALKEAFLIDKYITGERKRKLAEMTELTQNQVKNWFNYRRIKEKAKSNKTPAVKTRYSFSRCGYSKFQLRTLEAAFLEVNYAQGERRTQLAAATELTEKQVDRWFRDRRRRPRSGKDRFTKAQYKILDAAFSDSIYATNDKRRELADATDLTESQIGKWFNNKRRKGLDGSDSRQNRKAFTRAQYEILTAAFSENNYANKERKVELAKATGLTGTQIRIWFMNQRMFQLKRSDIRRENPFVFTSAQRAILVEAFAEDRYSNKEKRRKLAERTKLTEKQIRTWFKTERIRRKNRSAQQIQADMEVASEKVENVQAEPIDVTPDQEAILMEMFRKYRFLNMGELADMIEKTGLEEEQVKEWFRRQRELMKEEKVIKEEPEDEME